MRRNYEVPLLLWIVVLSNISGPDGASLAGTVRITSKPCIGTGFVKEFFETNRLPEEENQFNLTIATQDIPTKGLASGSKIHLKFDRAANVTNLQPYFGRVTSDTPGMVVITVTRAQAGFVSMVVRGTMGRHVPNLLSIVVDGAELCPNGVKKGHWDKFIRSEISEDPEPEDVPVPKTAVCGRRQIHHSALIFNAEPAKEGDWPWHTAIYKRKAKSPDPNYICGGSLLTPGRVLTAGHCVDEQGSIVEQSRLSVVVGKYNLFLDDQGSQKKLVFEIIVHPHFNYTSLKNDIAILVLSSLVVYSAFVQPICLWQRELTDRSSIDNQYGHVVGWGINEHNEISSTLSHAVMPVAPDATCLWKNPTFYGAFLNRERAFCAGSLNGTLVCKGDSGGGMFFPRTSSDGTETWYIRGIVSLSATKKLSCDTDSYTVFTDAARYLDWIERNL